MNNHLVLWQKEREQQHCSSEILRNGIYSCVTSGCLLYWLQCQMAQRCSAPAWLWHSIPGHPPPALRLIPATPVATCLVDFLTRAHRHLLGRSFGSSPVTPMLLCISGADCYHYTDETERPVFLGNTQACWSIWKMPYCLDAIRKSWLDLVFPDMPG